MRKTKHWLMTAALLLCSVVVSAEAVQIDGIWYDLVSDTQQAGVTSNPDDVTKYTGAIAIPSTVAYEDVEYSVISVGERAFYGCNNLTSITIPKGVTSIGNYAFRECYDLTSITLSESVESIGQYAFTNCSRLTSITIPASVKSIGDNAFNGCNSLTSIIIPESVTSIGNDAFQSCSRLTSIIVAEGNPIYDSRDGCNAIIETSSNTLLFGCSTTIIPESVTGIESYAFILCENLSSITIPESVTSIGDRAFNYCSSLTSITVAEGNPIYDSRKGCNAIIETNSNTLLFGCSTTFIPESVTCIKNYAFQSCSGLTSITIPEGMTSIGNWAFQRCSSLTSITCKAVVPPAIGGSYTFYNVDKSIPVYVPESSVTAYQAADGWKDFTNIQAMTETVQIDGIWYDLLSAPQQARVTSNPDGVTKYAGAVTIPSTVTYEDVGYSVTSIGENAFRSCSSLTSITIPENVTSIGGDAFNGCSSLTSFTIPEGVTSIEVGTFNGCNSLTAITIPEGVTSIGDWAFAYCRSLPSITIPKGVTSIGGDAFNYCSSLTSFTIPEGVTSIEVGTFNTCINLTSITIPEGVTSIGEWAFSYCYKLTSITIPEGVTSIGSCAFRDCRSLTSITISEGVTSIGGWTFAGCRSLTSITIPESVTSIGKYAFENCSSLTSITCEAVAPPTIGDSETFYNVDKSIPVYVPASSVSAYQTADGWKEFTNIQAIAGDVLATSLTLDITEASLAPDETLTLTATLLPEDATNPTLTWTSSNEKVATVDEYGVVTAIADGEATITVSTTDGSDLSATCVVTVETKEAEGDVTDYDNMIYFEDATVFVNTTVTLPLQMKNSASITAVQFDVYLPEGVTIEKTSRGKYNVTFNEDRADNTTHTLSSALQDDGAIRVLCYSTESYDFLGSEGAIFYFPLEIPEMEDGDYDVVIRNIVLTDVSGTKYEIPSMTSTMTVLNVAPGDCNADNTIDVADIVVLANHILGTTADGFVEKAADYNADGAVDVADIVNIANYILNGNHAGARALVREVVSTRAAAAGYSLDILPFVLDAEGSKTIALELTDPTESFTAFQCDLYLPEGISIETNNRGKYKFSFNEERTEAAYHTLSGSLQADGAVRMLCYSTDSEVFLGTEGALIYIPLTADASLAEGVYEFSIASTVLTYQDGVKVTPDTYKGSIVVGDGGEVQEVKLYGRYTSEVLGEYSTVLAANSCITSVDLTEAIYLPEDGLLTTGNPNTIVYLAEGDALANEVNVVTGDECASLVLTDGYAFAAPVAFSASQASYGRELAEGKYGTIVLPYAPDTDDYVFYALTSAGDDVLIFDEVETPAANTPYLYQLRDGKSATRITGNEVAVSSELTPGGTAAWQMVGSYANRTIAAGEDGDRYYYAYTSSDNKIHRVTNTLTVKPYRAYFTTASTVGTQLAIRTRGGEETLIDVTEVDGLCPEVYYDLSGRRVDNPAEGVYIVNGKKVVF